jgi:hypothetical protein
MQDSAANRLPHLKTLDRSSELDYFRPYENKS